MTHYGNGCPLHVEARNGAAYVHPARSIADESTSPKEKNNLCDQTSCAGDIEIVNEINDSSNFGQNMSPFRDNRKCISTCNRLA